MSWVPCQVDVLTASASVKHVALIEAALSPAWETHPSFQDPARKDLARSVRNLAARGVPAERWLQRNNKGWTSRGGRPLGFNIWRLHEEIMREVRRHVVPAIQAETMVTNGQPDYGSGRSRDNALDRATIRLWLEHSIDGKMVPTQIREEIAARFTREVREKDAAMLEAANAWANDDLLGGRILTCRACGEGAHVKPTDDVVFGSFPAPAVPKPGADGPNPLNRAEQRKAQLNEVKKMIASRSGEADGDMGAVAREMANNALVASNGQLIEQHARKRDAAKDERDRLLAIVLDPILVARLARLMHGDDVAACEVNLVSRIDAQKKVLHELDQNPPEQAPLLVAPVPEKLGTPPPEQEATEAIKEAEEEEGKVKEDDDDDYVGLSEDDDVNLSNDDDLLDDDDFDANDDDESDNSADERSEAFRDLDKREIRKVLEDHKAMLDKLAGGVGKKSNVHLAAWIACTGDHGKMNKLKSTVHLGPFTEDQIKHIQDVFTHRWGHRVIARMCHYELVPVRTAMDVLVMHRTGLSATAVPSHMEQKFA